MLPHSSASTGTAPDPETIFGFQYLKDWEVHLKSLHDSYPGARIVVSGSAAAALRRHSRESGAGRFTDFYLPPLTFREFLHLGGREEECVQPYGTGEPPAEAVDVNRLNEAFVDYLNYGGFPEAVLEQGVGVDAARYVRSDVLDKVLLRDLPSLYGIEDVQELNRFFAMLAYNTGQEVSLEGLSQRSHVAKNTLRRYLEYLEAAFLITTMDRVDRQGHRFQRRVAFKVHLTNPSLRTALFGSTGPDDPAMGALVETAIMAQWQHVAPDVGALVYARWGKGDDEVDVVGLSGDGLPEFAEEIKWSDRYVDRPNELSGLARFVQANPGCPARATTRTRWAQTHDPEVQHLPAAVRAYVIGRNLGVSGAYSTPRRS